MGLADETAPFQSNHPNNCPCSSTRELNLDIPIPGGIEKMAYYIFTFGGTNEQPVPMEMLALAMGETLRVAGVDLVYAYAYVSPVGIRADYLALHEVWDKMGEVRQRLFRDQYPELALALETAIGTGGKKE